MFAIPGILALLVFIYARPHEFVDLFRGLPLLYVFCGLAAFGLLIDIRIRALRTEAAPHAPWALAFAGWALLTAAIKAPSSLPSGALTVAILMLLYFVLAHGVQTFRAFQTVAAVVLGCVIFVAAVGTQQGFSPFECIAVDSKNAVELIGGKPDGRPCDTREMCLRDDPVPGTDYRCERPGLVGTTSIGSGRVRYLGVLQDPNEMALAICIGMPFAIAFFERRRSAARLALLSLTLALVATATVLSQSRGGQLVFLTVLGCYFLKRFGARGLVAGAVVAAPMLILGGRGGAEADSSSKERLECWYEGISMFKSAPVLGVGFRQFTEHHYLTAHNSYVLAPAELGFPGFVLWTAVMYTTTKIPAVALIRYRDGGDAEVARVWAMALLASILGLLVGIFFLSFCYHYVLWIYVGLSGAFYSAVRTHDREFEVRFGLRDLAAVVVIDVALIAALYVYTRVRAPS
jgi:hypothetical protein